MNDPERTDHIPVAAASERRFGGVARLYGDAAFARIRAASVAVMGIGGVGSWAAEALARSGVGHIVLIDLDHVAESNINRQIHALEETLGAAKVETMAQRIRAIDPAARVDAIDEFVTAENAESLLAGCDWVIDAIDQVKVKVAVIGLCHRLGIPVVTAGGAGGKTDPARIRVDDLSRTEQDPLLARVRKSLRQTQGFPRDPRRRFGVAAIYSDERLRYATEGGAGEAPQGLSCAGYGSSMVVTASFGLFAAAQVIDGLARGDA
ncbi:MAG: tRNA threonylcarbamoyladenosine dehydratase [Rhodocyclaceae bacterium]|nr:tRNA threonylcarbamoyladenosine dehydratase [Rhodocyclaceae bacterium]